MEGKGERVVLIGVMGRYHLEGTGVNEEDNIKTDHKEIWWKELDWICLAQDRD
jgi:hypothetical protein